MIDQSAANFIVERHRRARTHLSNPLGTDLIGEPSKAEYRDVNRPSFSRQGLDEIASAPGAVMLAKAGRARSLPGEVSY